MKISNSFKRFISFFESIISEEQKAKPFKKLEKKCCDTNVIVSYPIINNEEFYI